MMNYADFFETWGAYQFGESLSSNNFWNHFTQCSWSDAFKTAWNSYYAGDNFTALRHFCSDYGCEDDWLFRLLRLHGVGKCAIAIGDAYASLLCSLMAMREARMRNQMEWMASSAGMAAEALMYENASPHHVGSALRLLDLDLSLLRPGSRWIGRVFCARAYTLMAHGLNLRSKLDAGNPLHVSLRNQWKCYLLQASGAYREKEAQISARNLLQIDSAIERICPAQPFEQLGASQIKACADEIRSCLQHCRATQAVELNKPALVVLQNWMRQQQLPEKMQRPGIWEHNFLPQPQADDGYKFGVAYALREFVPVKISLPHSAGTSS